MSAPAAGRLRVDVVYALPDIQHQVSVELPAGATVADALRAAAQHPPFDTLDLAAAAIGVFGDRVERDRPLAPGDRVEIYRPLAIDPREARRRRAAPDRSGRR